MAMPLKKMAWQKTRSSVEARQEMLCQLFCSLKKDQLFQQVKSVHICALNRLPLRSSNDGESGIEKLSIKMQGSKPRHSHGLSVADNTHEKESVHFAPAALRDVRLFWFRIDAAPGNAAPTALVAFSPINRSADVIPQEGGNPGRCFIVKKSCRFQANRRTRKDGINDVSEIRGKVVCVSHLAAID